MLPTKMKDVSNAVIVIDDKGLIYRINPAAAHMFGYDAQELLNKPVNIVLPSSNSSSNAPNNNLIFEILQGGADQLYKQGIKKDGTAFAVDIFLVPFCKEGGQYYDCIIKDDSNRFFHERLETLSNVILRRVFIGESLEQFAGFIAEQLSIMFSSALVWVGRYDKEEQGVLVMAKAGEFAKESVCLGTLYTNVDVSVHPAVRACEKMEMSFDDVKDELDNSYRLMAFPFLSKKDVLGVMTILIPLSSLGHVILNRLENVALRLGMILQIAEDQTFLRLLGTAISSAMNAVAITDAAGKIIWINNAFTKLSGYALSDVFGQTPDILCSGLHTPSFYKDLWDTVFSGKTWRGEITNRAKDGSLFTSEEMITPIFNQDGKLTHFVIVNDDLTARKNAEGRILRLSNYDQLTDLPNRSFFQEKFKNVLTSIDDSSEILAVLLVDLSAFNRFNDTMGHAAGDQILKVIADRLLSCVTSKDFVARIEGDEFGIILRSASSLEEIGNVAHRIIRKIEEPVKIGSSEVHLGSCIGISLFPTDTREPDKLQNYADMALFKAKAAGQNTYFFFSQEMNQEMEERLILERDIRRALAEKQFFLDYQPQMDIKTGRITGFEALVRWHHPTKGLILPSLFISVAEDTGLVSPLCEYVMDTAFSQIKKWNRMGLGKLTMAVNLSAAQFTDKNLIATIKKLLEKKKISPSMIEFEITESLIMKNVELAGAILDELTYLGMRVSIDDFGTGYSSLSYLHKFAVDRLKIDKSFVQDLPENKENAEIIKAIISLGHALQLDVIAEGCETTEQLDILRKLGCDAIQGFLLARPLSAEKAQELLIEKNK